MADLKKAAMRLAERSLAVRKAARLVRFAGGRIIYGALCAAVPVRPRTVLFCAYGGKSYADSPKAIYEAMCRSHPDWHFVWAVRDVQKHAFLKENANTRLVRFGSKDYYKALAASECWVLNTMVDDFVFPKKGQTYLQCWHGTPLKKIGFDITYTDNAMNTLGEVHRRYRIDAKKFTYLLAPSAFAAKCFTSCWDLKKAKRENAILTAGYPRNDFLANHTPEDAARIKKALGIQNGKKVVLYAPTWRDNQHGESGYTFALPLDFDRLQSEIGRDCVVLFRAHYLVAAQFDFARYKGFVIDVSGWDDISELYIVSDLLMTDYSSVFFDYANLKRPMLFYMYDLAEYRDRLHGFYMDLAELPGRIVTDGNLLGGEIQTALSTFEYDEKYKAFNEKFNPLDDGHAAERVIEKLTGGN